MKINLSKQQYEDLLKAVSMSNTIYELLSDAVESDEIDFDENAERTRELQSYLLEFAEEFGVEEIVEEFDGELLLNEEYENEEIEPIMDAFEEYILHDALPNTLAWRDFNRDYTAEEQDKMEEENGNFFGVELFPYEERYRNEFEKYGFNRLFIKDDGKGEGMPSPYL